MWKATIRGILARRVRLALDGPRGRARGHVRERHVRAHRHARPVVQRCLQPDRRRRRPRGEGARRSTTGTGRVCSTCSGSPRPCSRACGRSTAWAAPTGSSTAPRSSSARTATTSRTATCRRSGSRGHSRATRDRSASSNDGKSHRAAGPDEVAMDAGTARGERLPRRRPRARAAAGTGAAVPDRRAVRLRQRTSSSPPPSRPFDLPTAQQAFAAEGELDAIDVIAAPGTDVAELRARIADRARPGLRRAVPRRQPRPTAASPSTTCSRCSPSCCSGSPRSASWSRPSSSSTRSRSSSRSGRASSGCCGRWARAGARS